MNQKGNGLIIVFIGIALFALLVGVVFYIFGTNEKHKSLEKTPIQSPLPLSKTEKAYKESTSSAEIIVKQGIVPQNFDECAKTRVGFSGDQFECPFTVWDSDEVGFNSCKEKGGSISHLDTFTAEHIPQQCTFIYINTNFIYRTFNFNDCVAYINGDALNYQDGCNLVLPLYSPTQKNYNLYKTEYGSLSEKCIEMGGEKFLQKGSFDHPNMTECVITFRKLIDD